MSFESKLFVTEEEDVPVPNSDGEPLTKDSNQDQDDDVEMSDGEQGEGQEEEDPVVQEIPLNLAGNDEILHVLQYSSKPKKIGSKPADHPFVGAARYKSDSSVWELDVPLDETAFYNKEKGEETWSNVNIQTLKGVAIDNEGQYTGFVSDGQIYLAPVQKVTQLKPFFKYIDNASQQKKQEEAKRNLNPASQKTQVITMSVKSVNDPTQNRLAGSLLAHKVLEEEEPKNLEWIEDSFDQFKESMISNASSHILKSVEDEQDYLSNIF